MSRNSNRRKMPVTKEQQAKQENPQPTTTPSQPQQRQSPFGLSFVVPTEIVHLPSGGDFYEEGSPLSGIASIEIKAMTAKEEDILINESFIDRGIVFDRLLDSLMITPGINSEDLLDCDKVALLINVLKSGYGDTVEISLNCESCGQTSQAEVSLSKMLEKNEQQKFTITDSDKWKYDANSRTLTTTLPVSNINVVLRMLSKSDQIYLQQAKERKEKLNLPHSETIEFIRRTLVSAEGETDPTILSQLIDVLPAADARRIKYVHNINIPKFDTTQEIECPNCSAIAEREVPFSVGWFWSL